ncbi:Zinc finger domain-containing protein, MqsA-type [Desulfonema limicola]|uniref:Zinc finger domain-containing protein, MqsA-type n=1 Tax=Desulfonema limicola TaxID=45656 RepID=A0A975GGI9_9BACT|nr:YgiT-type zinc finger protein [Desulfonema limicola]QTA80294.1 Zinc finger domain-containing protein, MqsA-type [Desulfonema limicola]
MNEYSECFYCGGIVKEQSLSREIWWKNRLYIFENVPMGVCMQCGEKVIKPKVAKHIDMLLKKRSEPQKILQVPVYRYIPLHAGEPVKSTA